ncbi:MAG: flagellar hook assembly protein FlgD [Candidatus Sedimenticola sp. (ex Thyasira tokunagai)]
MTTTTATDELLTSLGIQPFKEKAAINDPEELGMDAFLELMVTQLNNQDPFEPMDNSQMLTQMSQFASVSGLDKLNESFADLSSSMTSDQALQAGSLIGREVLVPTDTGYLTSGGTVRGQVELAHSADVVVRISDATGQMVRELNIGDHEGGAVQFSWDGITDSGDYANPGYYSIQVEAGGSEGTEALQTQLFAPVESVTIGGTGQGLTLNLGGLGPVAFDQVRQIN